MEDDGTTEMRAQGTYPGAQLHLFTAVWVLRPQGELPVGGQYLGITWSTRPLSHLGAGLGRFDDPVMTQFPAALPLSPAPGGLDTVLCPWINRRPEA